MKNATNWQSSNSSSSINWDKWLREVMANNTVEISRAELQKVLRDLLALDPDNFHDFAEALVERIFDK